LDTAALVDMLNGENRSVAVEYALVGVQAGKRDDDSDFHYVVVSRRGSWLSRSRLRGGWSPTAAASGQHQHKREQHCD
jgi:hypothetical protein